ncbi:hypothetical protein AB0I28_17780 [Phytomonospora sp. NPDC050363]|uniref:hypothetical protein n=1 Tax=Phytomonospora sp. NPDC050363 TaxID=3155642 RepID=UPI0033D57831
MTTAQKAVTTVVAVILVGIALLVIVVIADSPRDGRVGDEPVASSVDEMTYDEDVTALDVRADSGTVTIRPSEDDRVHIERSLAWGTGDTVAGQTWDGTVLLVDGRCEGACDAAYLITVPAGTAVSVTATSATVDISGVGGAVTAHVASGRLLVDDVTGPQRLTVESGELIATRLGSADVRAEATSAHAALDFTVPPSTLDSTVNSGDLTITVPRSPDGYRLDFVISSGDHSVTGVDENPASAHAITARATSAHVSVTGT